MPSICGFQAETANIQELAIGIGIEIGPKNHDATLFLDSDTDFGFNFHMSPKSSVF